jgi:N-acetylglucosamine kinase-like BadF-type ATPase
MAGAPEAAELVALLAAAERVIRRAVREAGIDPEAAAAACAALAGEYTAVAAAARGMELAPLLREAAETLRQRAKAATPRASPHGTGRWPRRR